MRHRLQVLTVLGALLVGVVSAAGPQLPATTERLTADEEKAIRQVVAEARMITGTRLTKPRPTRILIVAKELEDSYARKPQATARLLVEVIEKGRPWESRWAAAQIYALVDGPVRGAIFARFSDPKTWDDPLGDDRKTLRQRIHQSCVRLITEKEKGQADRKGK